MHKAERKKWYRNQPDVKERRNEQQRLYRARKRQERLGAEDVAGTSVHNNNGAETETKPKAVEPTDTHQTPTVSMPESSDKNNEQIASNDLQEEKRQSFSHKLKQHLTC